MQYLPLRESIFLIIIFIFFSLKSKILDFNYMIDSQVCIVQQLL